MSQVMVGYEKLAIIRCRFSATVEIAGQSTENTGKVLCSMQKDASGKWLAKAICFNWDRPLGGAR